MIELVVIDDQLLIVAEHGIYSVRLADQIDPERQNPAIPFAVRRQEIPYGADTEFVCQTVMTAKALANDAHLPDEAKGEAVLRIAMRAAFELAGAVDVANDLRVSEASMRARVARQELKPGYLPRTDNLRGRTEQAVAHLRAANLKSVELAELFYPKARPNLRWKPTLLAKLKASAGTDDKVAAHLEGVLNAIDTIFNYRHAFIHPDDVKNVRVFDYDLQPSGAICAPSIEIIHPNTPHERQDVVQFLDQHIAASANVFETLLTYCADRNAKQLPIFDSRVVRLPDGQTQDGSSFVWQTVPKNPAAFAAQFAEAARPAGQPGTDGTPETAG